MNSEAMRATLRVTKALSDMQRVRILIMLRRGELCVCQIIGVLELAPSTVSKHLSILDVAGLVRSRKAGRWAYYSLPKERNKTFSRPLIEWLVDALDEDETIRGDAKKLEKIMKCDPGTLCRQQRTARNAV